MIYDYLMMTLFDIFIINIILAGIGVAILTGVMGSFVVWKRMAYFGDSLSHSALLGAVMGIIMGIKIHIATIIVCLGFSMLLVYLQQKKLVSTDTLLGILAHGSLSFSLVAFSFLNQNIDLQSFLFGDILTVTSHETYWLWGTCGLIITIIYYYWSPLLTTIISEELALSEGINVYFLNLLFVILMALVVALSMNVIGVLLMTSLLIIPAGTGRQFSDSPKQMVFYSIFFSLIAVISGLMISIAWDTPLSPTIVSVSIIIFAISLILKYKKYAI